MSQRSRFSDGILALALVCIVAIVGISVGAWLRIQLTPREFNMQTDNNESQSVNTTPKVYTSIDADPDTDRQDAP